MPPAEEESEDSEDSDEEESEDDDSDDDTRERQTVFLVLEDWLDPRKSSDYQKYQMCTAGLRVAETVGIFMALHEPPDNLIEIYAGWSDDKIMSMAASTLDDLRLYPGYPPGEHTDAIANAASDVPPADDATNDDAELAGAFEGFELTDAAAKIVECGFTFGGELDDAAASGTADPETNLAAQQRPSPSSESGGGESTVTTRRGRGGDRSTGAVGGTTVRYGGGCAAAGFVPGALSP